MPAFAPAKVVEELDRVKVLAQKGLVLAGSGGTQVVLSDIEIRMLEWGIEQIKRA